MGTRHLTMILQDGGFKLTQYGQWDGYPAGQGKTICNFFQANMDRLDEFRSKVKQLKYLTDAAVDAISTTYSAVNGMMKLDDANKMEKEWPQLDRDMGAGVLQFILDQPPGAEVLIPDTSFAGDGLFCEWAYVVNLDPDTLEVYKGFHKGLLDPAERFADLQDPSSEYAPVKFVKSFPLSELDPETMVRLEASLREVDEDEDEDEDESEED